MTVFKPKLGKPHPDLQWWFKLYLRFMYSDNFITNYLTRRRIRGYFKKYGEFLGNKED